MKSQEEIRQSYDQLSVPLQMGHKIESPTFNEGLKIKEESQEFTTARIPKLPLLGNLNKFHIARQSARQSFTKTYLPKMKSALGVHHRVLSNWESYFLNTIHTENEHIKSKLNEYTQYAKKM